MDVCRNGSGTWRDILGQENEKLDVFLGYKETFWICVEIVEDGTEQGGGMLSVCPEADAPAGCAMDGMRTTGLAGLGVERPLVMGRIARTAGSMFTMRRRIKRT
jgi:hypothetical protein